MELTKHHNLVLERPAPGVWLARFTRPDARLHMDGLATEDSRLYHDLLSIVERMDAGETLLLNLGLIDWFPTAFYQTLLAVRSVVSAKKLRYALCCCPPAVKETLTLFKADKVFEMFPQEAGALKKLQS